MELNTASEAITYARRLEEQSASFYETCAAQFPEAAEMWRSLATENRKLFGHLEQIYYGAISDALEGGFAFRMTAEADDILTPIKPPANAPAALRTAIAIEGKIAAFYTAASTQARSLMADVSRAMALIARKRQPRIAMLTSRLYK